MKIMSDKPKIARLTKAEYDRRYFERFPEKKMAHQALKSVKKQPGFQLHHWSYEFEHLKDTIPMETSDHKTVHKFIVYDQERKAYRRYDNNVLLDTKQKHIDFINMILLTAKYRD